MGRISVLHQGLNDSDLTALLALLEAAGCISEDVELVDQVGEPIETCDDEVIVILLTDQLCQSSILEAELSEAPKGGRRAICVWPEGDVDREIPAAVEKFCYSIVSWNPDRLRVVLVDDDVTCFETPSGQPRSAPDTERHECL